METKDSPAAGLDEDLYSDGADGSDGGDKAESTDKPADDSADKQDDATEAVLPKSILAGKEFNVGDEVVLTVTGIHDDQISVKYSTGKGDKDPDADGDTDKAEMPAGMGGGDTDYD